MAIDYRALIAVRKAKQTRPIVRHEICLVPELHSELEQARELVEDWVKRDNDEDEPQDPRGGASGSPGLMEARRALAEVEGRVAEVSITAVFKAPAADRQAAISDDLRKAQQDEPERANTIVIDSTRALIVECFDHAEGPSREKLDLSRDDIASVIGEWTQGEIVILGNKIQDASVGVFDLPKSVLQSLRNRPSAATSKQR